MNTSSKRRPGGVWVVSIYYAVTLLSGIYFLYFRTSPIEQHVGAVSIFNQVALVVTQALNLGAAITLFLLRKISVLLMALALAASILCFLINILTTNLAQVWGSFGPIAAVIGYIPPVLVLLYARMLLKRGSLS